MIPLYDDNPTECPPIVTLILIAACSLVFLWQISHDTTQQEVITFSLGMIPATLAGSAELAPELYRVPPVVTLFSAMFLHGGWLHLLGNMLYLWVFGNNVEEAMGHGRFVLFYLLTGVVAAIAQMVPDPNSTVPMIGASGAIAGVLGAYLLLHPRARVLVAIPIGLFIYTPYLPAMVVLGVWFAIQVGSSLLSEGAGGGVAWLAHIGGFLAGVVLIPLFKRREVPLWAPARRPRQR